MERLGWERSVVGGGDGWGKVVMIVGVLGSIGRGQLRVIYGSGP